MKVKVDKEECIGCGFCFTNLEEIFKSDENGLSDVTNENIPTDKVDDVEDISMGCPVGAIKISED